MKTSVLFFIAGMVLLGHEGHGNKNIPESAKKLASPLTPDQSKPELGKSAYEGACAGCHGADGKSKTEAAAKMAHKPTNLTDHLMDSMKDGEIYWVVSNGVEKTMPAFQDKLNETERWQVVNYVRFLRSVQKAKAPDEHHR